MIYLFIYFNTKCHEMTYLHLVCFDLKIRKLEDETLLTVFLSLMLLYLMIILRVYRELCENLLSQRAWCLQRDLSASNQNFPNRF